MQCLVLYFACWCRAGLGGRREGGDGAEEDGRRRVTERRDERGEERKETDVRVVFVSYPSNLPTLVFRTWSCCVHIRKRPISEGSSGPPLEGVATLMVEKAAPEHPGTLPSSMPQGWLDGSILWCHACERISRTLPVTRSRDVASESITLTLCQKLNVSRSRDAIFQLIARDVTAETLRP